MCKASVCVESRSKSGRELRKGTAVMPALWQLTPLDHLYMVTGAHLIAPSSPVGWQLLVLG